MKILLTLLLTAGCAQQDGPVDSPPPPGDTEEPVSAPVPCADLWYPDEDGDGFGARVTALPACAGPPGWVLQGGDCDDGDPERHPGADERCNGVDDDCDDGVDEDFAEPQAAWYPDADGDGWGFGVDEHLLCGGEPGLVERPGDCNDADPTRNPAARELCNLIDDDCDGEADEGCGGRCRDGIKGGPWEACDGADDRACPGACSAHCACPSGAPGDLRVHFLDVGQGDAALVISPDGFVMLVDSGTSAACDELEWALDSLGIDAIDYTVVSHGHEDHLGNTDTLLDEHREVVAAFDNGGTYTSASYWYYRHAANPRRVGLEVGGLIDMGSQIEVSVLHAHAGASSSSENENSVVLALTHGDVRVLLGGDCEQPCEARLDAGPVDVYKVHHHGSFNASSQAFLEAIQPSVAIISVGEGNSYGHPSSLTLYNLAEIGATVLRTDLDGSILVQSDGEGYEVAGVPYTPSWK